MEFQYPSLTILYNLFLHPLAHIPGPRTWACSRLPFVKALISGTIVHDFEKLHRKYGPILRIAPNEVTFAHVEAWNDILQSRQGHGQFLKDPTWWKGQAGQTESLVSAIQPPAHARIRKALIPGFTTGALKTQEPILQRYANLLVERLRELIEDGDGSVFKSIGIDISPWLMYTTFDIFGDLGFGESFDCLEKSQYHPWIALLFNNVKAASFIIAARFYPMVEYLLMKCIPPSLKRMQSNHRQQIADKVYRRLSWELDRPDIMSHVIKQGHEKKSLRVDEINSTFIALTGAGSETTATTLCGALTYLVQSPEKLKTIEDEIRGAFSSIQDITLAALGELPYLNATLHEALRLCPPIPWILPRLVPVGGDTICGVWLPGGTRVSIQAWTMHRSPEYFRSPSSFEPERWLPEAKSDPKSPYFKDRREAVQPFSVGPRSCLGQHLAWAEMRLILSKLLWTFDFEAVEGKTLRWEDLRTFILVEKKPIELNMKLRLV